MAYTDWSDHNDWSDHDDHTDAAPYSDWTDHDDHHDHSDSDCAYTDWVDHTDGGHGDWDDHGDTPAHDDWDDHSDWGDVHGDWDDAHGDWTDSYLDWDDAHSDWDDAHDDWVNTHDDWTDSYIDWDDGHSDWDDHGDAGSPYEDWDDVYLDWDDHSDEGHDDHGDIPHEDHDDHDDHSDHDDTGYIDWDDAHSDWGDYNDSGEHTDWGNYSDAGSPHIDWQNGESHVNWSDAHTDWSDYDDTGEHIDWTNHSDAGEPHIDWSDNHQDHTDHDDHDDHDDGVPHEDWDDAHSDWDDHTDEGHGDHGDWDDAYSDWDNHSDAGGPHLDWGDGDPHGDWSDEHGDWTNHSDAGSPHLDWSDGDPHDDWTNAHVDWDDHSDYDDHDDGAPHTDWDDHSNDAHSDWDDHTDLNNPHSDWGDSHADWTDHDDWTNHSDAGSPHIDWGDGAPHGDHTDGPHDDWTDSYIDWDDAHTDWADAHDDWDDSHSDWTDYTDWTDVGIPDGKTHVSAWIGGKDVSCYIIGADIWRDALNGIGRWELVLDNQGHWWGGAFSVDDAVTIHINGSLMMMGYVDDIFPYIDSKGEYTEYIRVNGRDYGMDLAQLYMTNEYAINPVTALQWRADDIVHDVVTHQVACEITYNSPSAGPNTYYEFDRTYFTYGIRDIAKLVNYDFYVQDDVNRTLHFFDIATMGGGAEHTTVDLESVPGSATNNILRLDVGEEVGFDVKNVVEAHAGDLNDHYTDLNGVADWTPGGAAVTVTDDTVFRVSGKGAIRMTSTAPGTNLYMTLQFPLYNHASLDMSEPSTGRYAAFPHYAAAPNYPIRLRLRDTAGVWIEYYSITTPLTGQPPPHETTDNTRVDDWRYIDFAYGDGTEIRPVGILFVHRTWHYLAPGVVFDWSQIDRIRFTASPLLMRANGDYCIIDELRIPAVEVISIWTDPTPIGGIRMKDFYRPDIRSQVELDAYAVDQLAKYSNPMQTVKITAIGQVDSNYAAQSLDVLAPSSGIVPVAPATHVPYRILHLHHSVKLSPLNNEIVGYDYITEYELIRHEIDGVVQQVDPVRARTSSRPTEALVMQVIEEQRHRQAIPDVR